jgi:hypothetical protein
MRRVEAENEIFLLTDKERVKDSFSVDEEWNGSLRQTDRVLTWIVDSPRIFPWSASWF